MTTCNDVVRRGLRAMGAIQAGKVPTGINADSGLEYLQSLILDLPGLLKNARWREVGVTTAYTAHEGDRCTILSGGSVTLPLIVTHHGHTRPPRDLARIQIVGAVSNVGIWIYSGTKGAWAKVNGLALTDDFPFGDEDVQGVAMLLAVDIAAEFGAENELGQRQIAMATAAVKSLRSRFKKHEHHEEDCWPADASFEPTTTDPSLDFSIASNSGYQTL